MARSEAPSPWTTRHGPAALALGVLFAAAWPGAPPVYAQRPVPPSLGRVEIVLDVSGGTAGRPGVPGRALTQIQNTEPTRLTPNADSLFYI
jgi:hypothetical protein